MIDTQNWFTVEITVVSEAAEAIEFGLNELDALGTEINNLGKNPTETLCVIGYFNEIPGDETLRFQLDEALRIYDFPPEAIRQINSRKVGNVDWLYEWKKHWKPTELEKFIVAPTWETIENTEKIVIYIEPNMAFGTGTHETTRLCLQAVGENYQPEMSFLDVGTGTGILTIAAAKMRLKDENESNIADSEFKVKTVVSPDSFWACDTDEPSIEIAGVNAKINNVDGVKFFAGSISETTPPFDFVCANLTVDIILPILPILIEKAGKILVLSGILKEQENLIIAELEKLRIENPKIETLGVWISVSIKNEL